MCTKQTIKVSSNQATKIKTTCHCTSFASKSPGHFFYFQAIPNFHHPNWRVPRNRAVGNIFGSRSHLTISLQRLISLLSHFMGVFVCVRVFIFCVYLSKSFATKIQKGWTKTIRLFQKNWMAKEKKNSIQTRAQTNKSNTEKCPMCLCI